MLNVLRGMNDLYEKELKIWRYVENKAVECFLGYGYEEIRTPILEEVKLFVRSIGKTSDIVEKEMYTFKDKSGKILALRPENTASIVRSVVEKKMFSSQSNKKYFYIGPMFRRDRPQKGRLRQFHQIGAEAFGFEEALIDIEAISMLIDFLYKIGIYDFILNINSLGQIDEKAVFIKELSKYLAGKVNQLCNNCFHRIKINILRVLDCKIGSCRELLKNAPMMFNFLNLESKNHFETLKAGLQSLNIKFIISQNLVRGLDYYTRTVFEITTNKLGAKNVIAAGGRYDNLVKNLGGKNIPAFGFSIGIERMLLSLTKKIVIGNKVNLDIVLIYADKYGRDFVFLFAQKLRIIGLKVVTVLQFKSIKSQMRYANKIQARSVLVIGKKELLCKQGELKMLFNKVRIKVKLHPQEIADRLIE